MYHANIERTGRGVSVRISDGWMVSRMYAHSEGELREELGRHRIRPVSELTKTMCHGSRVDERQARIIHKLL